MTLRARVLLGLALIAVVLLGTAFAVPRITAAYLVDQVDAQLEQAGGPIGIRFDGAGELPRPSLDEAEGEGGVFTSPAPQAGEEVRPSRIFVGRIAAGGDLEDVFLPNFGDTDAPRIDVVEAVERADEGPFTVSGPTRYRLQSHTIGPDEDILIVGLPLDDVDQTVDRLVRIELVALLVILTTLGLVGWWVIRLGVRPVNEMAEAATEIGAGDLSARVPEYDGKTEAGRLGLALNQMLGRIEGEFEQRRRTEDRLRQFAADASHELRTPVTTVRGYAELYRSGALDEPGELAEAMRRVEQETVRMGELVDDLLRLARLDQGRQVERTAVDLAAVVRDAGRDAQATEPDRPITVEADGAAVVPGDERLLRQLVANLTANALVHTESTVAIHLRASVEGDRAVVEVRDEGPGMAPEVAERVFERFYRADPSRSRHSGGSGLGLAIVEATVHAHGGAVAVTTVPGEGTTFRVELPTD